MASLALFINHNGNNQMARFLWLILICKIELGSREYIVYILLLFNHKPQWFPGGLSSKH